MAWIQRAFTPSAVYRARASPPHGPGRNKWLPFLFGAVFTSAATLAADEITNDGTEDEDFELVQVQVIR